MGFIPISSPILYMLASLLVYVIMQVLAIASLTLGHEDFTRGGKSWSESYQDENRCNC